MPPALKDIRQGIEKMSVITNQLISALPAKERSRLVASCDEVDLEFADVLGDSGEQIRHVYFPLDAFVSLVTPIEQAAVLEVGMVGNEGMHGISLALGVNIWPLHSIVQRGGSALRMSAAAFIREHNRSLPLQRTLDHYVYVLMRQLAQSAVCTRFHVVEARLARWLLMTQDRAHSPTFDVTHKVLALMLGVRRTGVSEAANSLQKRNLIAYHRGRVTVLNRSSLKVVSCTCYSEDKRSYAQLFGNTPSYRNVDHAPTTRG